MNAREDGHFLLKEKRLEKKFSSIVAFVLNAWIGNDEFSPDENVSCFVNHDHSRFIINR